MSTMPLPIVCATAVPKTNAATKLKNAAQMTALPGRQHARRDDRRDRVGGVVKAVDVVEDERDEDEAADGPEEHQRLAVLDRRRLRGRWRRPRSGRSPLEEVERLLPLHDDDRVRLLVEQPADGLLVHAVGLVLEAVDLDGVRAEALAASLERRERLADFHRWTPR